MLVALGTPLKARPRPWEHFKVPAIMVNAYEIIKNKNMRKKIEEKGLHDFLGYDGIIFMDSGGFQAMKHGVEIEINELISIYKAIEADYYFSLDYPSLLARDSRKDVKKTVFNFEKLIKKVENVIPIVHPSIKRALEEYNAYKKYNPTYIAIGGLVPLVLTTKGLNNGRERAINLIAEIRRMHNNLLHVMGLGAPTIIPILKVLKCNSSDSSSWRVKAAHGKIMLLDGGERYISGRGANFGAIPLSNDEMLLIDKLKCPIIGEYGWEGLKNSFEIRALFNAWITIHVCNINSEQISGPFRKLLNYASSL